MDSPELKKTTKQHLRDVFNDDDFRSALLKRTTHTVLCYDELAPETADEP